MLLNGGNENWLSMAAMAAILPVFYYQCQCLADVANGSAARNENGLA